jgi:PilZ domain
MTTGSAPTKIFSPAAPSGLATPDRRRSPRFTVSFRGVLIFTIAGEKKAAACTILDLSEHGARVAIPKVDELPKIVVLYDGKQGSFHQCEIRWRKPGEAGLQFVDVVSRRLQKELISCLGNAGIDNTKNNPSKEQGQAATHLRGNNESREPISVTSEMIETGAAVLQEYLGLAPHWARRLAVDVYKAMSERSIHLSQTGKNPRGDDGIPRSRF